MAIAPVVPQARGWEPSSVCRISRIFIPSCDKGTTDPGPLVAGFRTPWRCSLPEHFQAGVVNVPKPGQLVCGDSWGIEQTADQTSILVADGLGHGSEARDASAEAVRIFHSNASASPQALIERVHAALRSTRGAAVAVARIDCDQEKVFFCGVGNISAHIYSESSGASIWCP